MSSSNPCNGPTLSLKVAMNKQKTKVLFAEANSSFVNVLLSFLTLPLGKAITILHQHDEGAATAVGSLNTLYNGLLNLDDSFFCVSGAKQMLLNPQSSFRAECRKLTIDITHDSLSNNEYFVCQNEYCRFHQGDNISLYSDIAKCKCGKSLNREIYVAEAEAESLDDGAFIANPTLVFLFLGISLLLSPMI